MAILKLLKLRNKEVVPNIAQKREKREREMELDANQVTGTGLLPDICPKCGKPYVYVGDVPDGGWMKGLSPVCDCGSADENNAIWIYSKNPGGVTTGRMGWICPKCNKSVSPDKEYCC